jgi:MATE family multidrug resistance protein
VGQLGMVLTGFFDNLMVAKLGHEQLAAAGICNSIYFLLAIFPMGVTMAYATIVGLLQGSNRINASHLLVKDSFKTTVWLCIVTTLVLILSLRYFHVFNQPDSVTVLAKPYLLLLTISLTPMLLFFFAKNLCDGFGYTRGGMIVTLSTLVLNVFLNWVFIYGNWGSPMPMV